MTAPELKVGQRWKSVVDSTEVIIVRTSDELLPLTCGGRPMVDVADASASVAVPDPDLMTGAPVGKRFTSSDGGLEVLVTKGGSGTLGLDTTPLIAKSARPLPSSD